MFEDVFDIVETPCLLVDRKIMEENLKSMQTIADASGVALRPHVKTHKIPEYARLQVELGAKGITCAKVSEAEVMADGGLDDIFLAYPQVGKSRIERVVALAKRIKRLVVGVDSIATATMLSDAAMRASSRIEVRLEIDTGARRTGSAMAEFSVLGREISRLPGIELTGIYTFKSLVLNGVPTDDRDAAGREEGKLMAFAADELRYHGVVVSEISAGSTPTGTNVAATRMVTEIRPGTYIFNDYMLTKENWTTMEHIAARLLATVVSVSSEGYAVIDGGTKTFPTDAIPCIVPYYYPGYAVVESGNDLVLRRMYEEHGIVESLHGEATGLKVGDVISLVPIHVCTAVNLQNYIYEYNDGSLRKLAVMARGMLV